MPHPRAGYKLKDGTKVPSVTQICGRFKDSSALIMWAHKQGLAGKQRLYDDVEKAANIGTTAHALVEAHVKGATPAERIAICESMLTDEADRLKAYSAFGAYELWQANFKVKVIAQEIELVSEVHKFGGCPDFIGTIGNELALFDIKTSGSIYTDYLVQVAAYGLLWSENYPDQPITGGFHILRFSKENSDFGHYHYPNLDEAARQFVLFRESWDLDKILKKRAA